MPGRVILEFKAAIQQRGSIIIPETSQTREEFGTIYDIGDALTEEDQRHRDILVELKREGKKLAVSYAAGVCYWDDAKYKGSEDRLGWLKHLRVFPLSQVGAWVEE